MKIKKTVPTIPKWIMERLRNKRDHESLFGDYEEIYCLFYEKYGRRKANVWYWKQVLGSLPFFFFNSIYGRMSMLKNYLKITFRNLLRSKGYSFLNIAGLAIGMTCSILIFLFVADEMNYDKFHKNSCNIYRLSNNDGLAMSGLISTIVKNEVPEVKDYIRIYATKLFMGEVLLSTENKGFYVKNFFMADPSIFRIFSFEFIKGNAESVFNTLESIVITEEMAKKFFGKENPIGKIISYDNKSIYTVTGVIKKLPPNSHFHVDCVIPLKNYTTFYNLPLDSFNNWAFITYFLTTPGVNVEKIETKIDKLIFEYSKGKIKSKVNLQSLTDIHLKSNLTDELEVNGNMNNVYVFIAIAILVLLIASVNFINLTTARSTKRAREVGVRKVIGAGRNSLIIQFLIESILMSLTALIFAILLVVLLIPYFNIISGKQFVITTFLKTDLIMMFISLAIMIGFLAGSFPAFVISSFKPVSVLKSNFITSKTNRFSFRNILVVTQFTIAICLIACTVVIYNQMEYMHNADLGLDKSKMVVIPIGRNELTIAKVGVLKNHLEKIESVKHVTASSRTPGHRPWGRGIKKLENENSNYEDFTIYTLWVDFNFIDTYKIEIVAGRGFSKEYGMDESSAFIINETAANKLGWYEPINAIGRKIVSDGKKGEIIGVAKDFHFLTLHTEIKPMIMHIKPEAYFMVSVKLHSASFMEPIKELSKVWEKIIPNRPFEYFILDNDLSKQYKTDYNTRKLMTYFSLLSLFITCLGLLGLASYSAEQKRKEIGIRKVLGATTKDVLKLLIKRFFFLTLLGNFVAWPIAYFVMTNWLENFAYRIAISAGPFAISAGIALFIAIVSVGFQSVKAAMANPIDTIKYE
jgi:putative ABC transport system permease protein